MRILTREPDCIAPIRNLSSLILSCQAWIPPLRLLWGHHASFLYHMISLNALWLKPHILCKKQKKKRIS